MKKRILVALSLSAFTAAPVSAADSFFTLTKSGETALQKQNYAEAEKNFSSALEIAVKKGGKNKDYADTLLHLGDLFSTTGKNDRALHDYQQASDVYKRIFGQTSLQFASALHKRAELHRRLKQFDQAIPLYKQALSIRSTDAQGHTDLAETSLGLAKVYLRQGKGELAVPLLKRAAQIQETAYGKNSHQVAMTYLKLAETYENLGKSDLAVQMYKKAIPTAEVVYGTSSARVASASEKVAALLAKGGSYKDSAYYWQKAIKIRETSKSKSKSNSDKLARARQEYAKVMQKKGTK